MAIRLLFFSLLILGVQCCHRSTTTRRPTTTTSLPTTTTSITTTTTKPTTTKSTTTPTTTKPTTTPTTTKPTTTSTTTKPSTTTTSATTTNHKTSTTESTIKTTTAGPIPGPLKLPNIYTASGEIHLPYAEIVEPFTAYFDGPNNRSRVDYYNGLALTFQRPDIKPYGVNRKIVYMTTSKELNVKRCFEINGTKNATITDVQSVFPDITNYHYNYTGKQQYSGKLYDVWQCIHNDKDGPAKTNTYRLWMSQGKNPIPVRFEMMGYDSTFGSHYDRYEIFYKKVKVMKNIPSENFEIPKSIKKCTGFPGPGKMLFNPMKEFVNHDQSHIEEAFDEFKQNHNKVYNNHEEHEKRKNHFRHNFRFIQSTNRQRNTFSLGVNHLADWSDEEMKILRGRLKPTLDYNGALPYDSSDFNIQYVPDSLDWRLYGAVTPVKDQAICGSCWSFGTTGTIEGAYFVQTGKLVRLSQQALMDCSWGYGNNACDGGEDFRAYQWIMENGGIPLADVYGPYLGQDGMCTNPKTIAKSDKVQITGYHNITQNDQQELTLAMFHHGPISVGIDASHKTFSFYANGVYYDSKCKNGPDDLDHSVLAVGFGILQGERYWLIKNSWSTYWGNDGYVLINQKNNNCGVATSPTFVTFN